MFIIIYWPSIKTFIQLFVDHFRFDNFTIIDCREQYEYEGGQIKGAINFCPSKGEHIIKNLYHQIWEPRPIYIFSCEISQKPPNAWRQFKHEHEITNENYLLHAFVLSGGFCKYFKQFPDYCVGKYVHEERKSLNTKNQS